MSSKSPKKPRVRSCSFLRRRLRGSSHPRRRHDSFQHLVRSLPETVPDPIIPEITLALSTGKFFTIPRTIKILGNSIRIDLSTRLTRRLISLSSCLVLADGEYSGSGKIDCMKITERLPCCRQCPGRYLVFDLLFITVATFMAVFDVRPSEPIELSSSTSGIAVSVVNFLQNDEALFFDVLIFYRRAEALNCVLTYRNIDAMTLLEPIRKTAQASEHL